MELTNRAKPISRRVGRVAAASLVLVVAQTAAAATPTSPARPAQATPTTGTTGLSGDTAPTTTTDAFGAATELATTGATGVSVAMNAGGNALIAWNDETDLGHLFARTVGAAGKLGPLQSLWSGAGYHATAAMAPDGTAAIGWLSGLQMEAVVAKPSKAFGTPQTLGTVKNGNSNSATMVATAGRAVAIWLASNSSGSTQIQYSVAGSDGKFGAAQTLGSTDLAPPLMATTDSAGNIYVAFWTSATALNAKSKSKPSAQLAYAVMQPGSATFDATQTIAVLAPKIKPSLNVSLGSGPGGVAIAFAGSSFKLGTLTATGLGSPLAVAGSLPTPPTYTGPVVAFPGDGGEVAAWSENSGKATNGPINRGHLVVSAEPAGGGTFTASRLTAPTSISQSPIATSTSDLAIVVFGEGPENNELLNYSVRPSGGSFTSPQTLTTTPLVAPYQSPSSNSVYLSPLPVSLAAGRKHAIVAWINGETLWTARLDET